MENFGLVKLKYLNKDKFTSNYGIKLRRFINPCLKKILKISTKRNIIVENYPVLKKNEVYIFASTHSFDEDIIAALSTIDRSTYVLLGTTDQVDHNPQMYAAWINGMIYVDRNNTQSRKESVEKMERIIDSGTSVLLFPEGGWNNTENLLVLPLFAGPYTLAQKTGKKVIPIATFNEPGSNNIYMNFGDPLDLSCKSKKQALIELRDSLGTMMYNHIEKHSTPLQRNNLTGDIRAKFMEERKNEYLRVSWTKDVWDEELTVYKDKMLAQESDVWGCLEQIDINKENAYFVEPIVKQLEKEKKYNFKKYMKENWNK